MSTEMKTVLAVLLLAGVCTVYGEKCARAKDVCTQGMAAVEVFTRHRGCGEPHPRRMLRELMRSLRNNVTVDTLRHIFTNYCSTIPPRLRQCFERNIQNCSADQQQSLRTWTQYTGALCQPNSTSIEPQISHLLTRLTDDDLVVNQDCFSFDRSSIQEECRNRSIVAMGLPSGNFRLLHNLTMEELAPRIRVFFSTAVECMITGIRDNPNRCPQWRGLALRAIGFYILWPVLGNRMTFTNQDIDRMFEWDSPIRREDTGDVDDVFQWNEDWL